MAYDPQQQRPEEQELNNNRESLNIRQPGVPVSTGNRCEKRTEPPEEN